MFLSGNNIFGKKKRWKKDVWHYMPQVPMRFKAAYPKHYVISDESH